MPELVTGNVLAKQLTFLAGADAAPVVVGAKIPIVLTGRADSQAVRITSCAVAVLMAHAEWYLRSLSRHVRLLLSRHLTRSIAW